MPDHPPRERDTPKPFTGLWQVRAYTRFELEEEKHPRNKFPGCTPLHLDLALVDVFNCAGVALRHHVALDLHRWRKLIFILGKVAF